MLTLRRAGVGGLQRPSGPVGTPPFWGNSAKKNKDKTAKQKNAEQKTEPGRTQKDTSLPYRE